MVAINNTTSQSALSLDIASALNHVFVAFDKATSSVKATIAFNKTVAELNSLSDRELADIGICRGDIKSIASMNF